MVDAYHHLISTYVISFGDDLVNSNLQDVAVVL